MPFFIRKPLKRKLKENEKKTTKSKKISHVENGPNNVRDHEIESESDEDDVPDDRAVYSEDEDSYLTAQEKKVKLAKKYLEAVKQEETLKLDSTEELNDQVLKRLKEDELEKAGKLKKKIADIIEFDLESINTLTCKQHKLSITCMKISWDNLHLYSASKDCAIVKWSLESFTKVTCILFKTKKKAAGSSSQSQRHKGTINCLAVSSDNKHLVSGDENGVINVWVASNLEFLHTLDGHKSSISDLAICPSTNSLYSTSKDALIKVWNLNEFGYMETLFGHQTAITSVDILNEDRIVTSGGTDKTIRVWKIQDESHTIFNGHSGSIDIVRKLDEGFFVSGGDDGCLCLWGALKKRPLHTEHNVHGLCSNNDQPNWVSALAVVPNGDLIASGSCNGYISVWKWPHGNKTFQCLRNIPVKGFINSLQFTSDARYLIVGIGREHRLGRWQVINEVKNSILCIPLSIKDLIQQPT